MNVFPMLKRMVPNIIGQDILGVQPMASPTNMVFAQRYYISLKKLINQYVRKRDPKTLQYIIDHLDDYKNEPEYYYIVKLLKRKTV